MKTSGTTFPTFLGIGAQRSGTTWLHSLLASHPNIYMPQRRKEIHYFDLYHSRGDKWYQSFFCDVNPHHLAVGEITPDYLYEADVAERIRAALPKVKLLVLLRNPVDRAFSHYAKLVRDDYWKASFEESLACRPELLERGFYSRFLERYYELFPPEQLFITLFETALADVDGFKRDVAQFLGVTADSFPPEAGHSRIHESFVPRNRQLYALSKSVARRLHQVDLDRVVTWATSLGIPSLFGKTSGLTPMSPSTRQSLYDFYMQERAALRDLTQLDLTAWEGARKPT